MSKRGKAPTTATFVICLILYVLALAGHFGLVSTGSVAGQDVADSAWIIGFGLLLLGVQVKGL
jgi:hypothetical protein